MRMQCWIYATVVAGEEECIAKCAVLRESLNPLLEAGAFLGWQASSLLTHEDYREKDVDPEWVEPVTHGALPAIQLNVTYGSGPTSTKQRRSRRHSFADGFQVRWQGWTRRMVSGTEAKAPAREQSI
jgi:hypothetical protein